MEILHKAALYAVLTFVIVGAAISLAGPERVSAPAVDSQETATEGQNALELAANEADQSEPNGT